MSEFITRAGRILEILDDVSHPYWRRLAGAFAQVNGLSSEMTHEKTWRGLLKSLGRIHHLIEKHAEILREFEDYARLPVQDLRRLLDSLRGFAKSGIEDEVGCVLDDLMTPGPALEPAIEIARQHKELFAPLIVDRLWYFEAGARKGTAPKKQAAKVPLLLMAEWHYADALPAVLALLGAPFKKVRHLLGAPTSRLLPVVVEQIKGAPLDDSERRLIQDASGDRMFYEEVDGTPTLKDLADTVLTVHWLDTICDQRDNKSPSTTRTVPGQAKGGRPSRQPSTQEETSGRAADPGQASRPLMTTRPEASTMSRTATVERVGRNDPCRCGSGRKFKRCCGARR